MIFFQSQNIASKIGGVLALSFSLVAAAPLVDASPPASGWLNAKDFGASGSERSTVAVVAKGVKQITVKDVADFQVGQGVTLSECLPQIVEQQLWGPRGEVVMARKLEGKAEIRGYDGSQGAWVVLLLDIAEGSNEFRWSEDLGGSWKAEQIITGDWQPIRDGIEVRFNPFEWDKGYSVVFSGRGQLVTKIEKIEGKKLTLRDAPTRAVKASVLRHNDDAALQLAINQALKEKRNLYVPKGRYRLSRSLRVDGADGITMQGENARQTIFDVSEGNGGCVYIVRGKEFTLRNFTMVGHSGFDKRDQCGMIQLKGSSYFWGFGAKNCNAVTINRTERVLIENCHGRKMASECFVSGSGGRPTKEKPNENHTQQTTYLNCSVVDCARNAFNDVTSGPENTSVINCRIVDVGGCAWEGASRFVKFVGNYVRNAGTVAIGNLGVHNRDPLFPKLGSGQHIISNNVFESKVPYGISAIRSTVGSTQVIISNNLFVNFGASAVDASGNSDPTHYASANTTITGNIFDMTEVGETSIARIAIEVSASDTIVSDNQIYVRGEADAKVTAIKLREPAVNVNIHDNLIRNCGVGIVTGHVRERVGQVFDGKTFAPSNTSIPLDPMRSSQAKGWKVVWPVSAKFARVSLLEAVVGAAKPETVRFKLREAHEMKTGYIFEVLPPSCNWMIHDNTITECKQPVVLDSYGSPTTVFGGNLVSRGRTAGVLTAVMVGGDYKMIGNQISGFDEKGAVAFNLKMDRAVSSGRMFFQGNMIEDCAVAVKTADPKLKAAALSAGNLYINCKTD